MVVNVTYLAKNAADKWAYDERLLLPTFQRESLLVFADGVTCLTHSGVAAQRLDRPVISLPMANFADYYEKPDALTHALLGAAPKATP